MRDWRDYAPEELDRQYRAIVPADFETRVIPAWVRRSTAFRWQARGWLDMAYGERPRERIDLFRSRLGEAGPLLVFFHGGYWQRFDKSVFSFVAEGLVAEGVSVALVGYDLCPQVRIGDITAQARAAVSWLWRKAPDLGVSRDRLFVSGHSAGGHLTAMVCATSWPQIGAELPADLVKGGAPISGLFELEPLCGTAVNGALRMDRDEAVRESPIHHPPAPWAPQLVVCGEGEPAEFHRQSDAYAAAFAQGGRIERLTLAGRDHMDELDELSDPRGALFARLVERMER